MDKPENPPAFPTFSEYEAEHVGGMELRDYFAAQALAGIAANSDYLVASEKVAQSDGRDVSDVVAQAAYELAKAMLAERSK